jgi:carbon storage regulator CsrA
MLVLTRRLNETIVLPDLNVTIQVVGIKSGAIRLGITAPPGVRVLRGELPDREAEWGKARPQAAPPAPEPQAPPLNQVVRQRLRVSRVGLAEVQRLVRAGRIEEAQRLLEKIDEDVALLERRLEDGPARRGPAGKAGGKALLVEDDRKACELLAECLRLAGMDVATADDGDTALDYLQTHDRPDVLLLDMAMPRCDGPTTLRAIRRNPAYAGMRIFALSGYAPDQFDVKLGPDGLNGWYQKPVDPEALLRDLGRELGQARNRLQPSTASHPATPTKATRAGRPGAPGTGRFRQGT